MEILIIVLLSFGLLPIAYAAGSHIERTHLAELEQREDALRHMLVTDLGSFPQHSQRGAALVTGEVVLAADHFKVWLLSWRAMFGGEALSFRNLMSRARREATLRLMEDAHAQGYNAVCNLRFETSDIGGNVQYNGRPNRLVVILAVGTAYRIGAAPQLIGHRGQLPHEADGSV